MKTKMTFDQKAQALTTNVIANFDTTKLEYDETLQSVVSSDSASVAVSNKRAYFSGNYYGSVAGSGTNDIVHLHTIRDVRLKNSHRKGTAKGLIKYLIYMVFILCINLIVNYQYQNAVDDKHSADRKLKTLKEESNYYYDSNFYDYYLTDNDNFSRINPYSASEIAARGADQEKIEKARIHADNLEESLKIKMIVRIIIFFLSGILVLINIVRLLHFLKKSKIIIMEFDCMNRRLGLELRNFNQYPYIRNQILLSRSYT